jgi:hypothetical protein
VRLPRVGSGNEVRRPGRRACDCIGRAWVDSVPWYGGYPTAVEPLRISSLSSDPGQPSMLHSTKSVITGDAPRVEVGADWAGGWRGCLIWGVPAGILLATPLSAQRYLVVIWPVLLTFMGVACLLNAHRCRRVHCYLTGPFFLLLGALALLYGIGVVGLGAHGWSTLSATFVIGGVTLTCVPEWLVGRYRSPSASRC